ncbi:MAG: hypothetical protein ABI740_00745 [Alphaproteobacteria bacterium]
MTAILKASPPLGGLSDHLRKLAQGRDALDIAQFQFVGFEEIRAAYGDRWPQQKAHIKEVAAGFLRRRMDSSDLLISSGGGFVVVFGSASGSDAEAAAGQLSHGLNEFFLGGAASAPAPHVSFASHAVPVAELSQCLGDQPCVTAEHGQEPSQAFGLSQLEWRFQPVWDVKHETLSNWYVTACLASTQARLPGYQFEALAPRPHQLATVDEVAINVSEQVVQELVGQGKQALIGVSIHACTLTNLATRARVVSLIDRLDRELFRYRVIKIAGVAPGFPRLYLNEVVQLFKARALRVVVGAAWDEPDIAGLLQSGAAAVGVALPMSVVGPSAAIPPATLWAKLTADIRLAHLHKARFFVEGDIAPAMALRIGALGADNISSPRIWPLTGTADAMLKWPASRLLAAGN